MTRKYLIVSLLGAGLWLCNVVASGWCESSIDVGDYHVGLTSKRFSDNQCVKPGSAGKIYSFIPSILEYSTSCSAYPRVYCGNTFVAELPFTSVNITCSAGESIRIGYDNVCADLKNHIEGIITVTEDPTPSPTPTSTPTPVPTPSSAPTNNNNSNDGWVYWVVSSVCVAASIGGYCLYKYKSLKSHHRGGDELGVSLLDPIAVAE